MSKPTIQEMREQLVNNEIDYISQMVIQDKFQELFDYVMKNCGFKDDEDTEIESIYMDLYGDMINEQEISDDS